jgi:hypothetical protein
MSNSTKLRRGKDCKHKIAYKIENRFIRHEILLLQSNDHMPDTKFLTPSEINTAPWVFKSEIVLDISIYECWTIVTDDRAWEHWHPEVTDIRNTEEPAGGVGNSRTVVFRPRLGSPTPLHETFDVWEHDDDIVKRFQFWFTGGREEFKVEAISSSSCKLTRTVALAPGFVTRYVLGWLVYPELKRLFTVLCPKRLTEAVAMKVLPINAKQ